MGADRKLWRPRGGCARRGQPARRQTSLPPRGRTPGARALLVPRAPPTSPPHATLRYPRPDQLSWFAPDPYTQWHQEVTNIQNGGGSRLAERREIVCLRPIPQPAGGVVGMNIQANPQSTAVAVTEAPPVNRPHTSTLLSVNDVCLALQCGRTFVYELLQKGELRPIKLGRLTDLAKGARRLPRRQAGRRVQRVGPQD